MSDFNTIAKTGEDFVNIVFEHASDDIENIMIDLSVDGMKMKTFICDGTENSLTVQPLAAGDYQYRIAQISGNGIKNAEGGFTIDGKKHNEISSAGYEYVPLYHFLSKHDLESLTSLLHMRTYSEEKGEINVIWNNDGITFKNIYIGLKPSISSSVIIEEACLDGDETEYTFENIELDKPVIFLDFLLSNGQNICYYLQMCEQLQDRERRRGEHSYHYSLSSKGVFSDPRMPNTAGKNGMIAIPY